MSVYMGGRICAANPCVDDENVNRLITGLRQVAVWMGDHVVPPSSVTEKPPTPAGLGMMTRHPCTALVKVTHSSLESPIFVSSVPRFCQVWPPSVVRR